MFKLAIASRVQRLPFHGRMLRVGFLAIMLSMLLPSIALSQGVLFVENHDGPIQLPRPIPAVREVPSAPYSIKEFSIQARIEDQVAQTQVTQSFVNTGSRQIEVSFVFPLPYDGAIDRLTFMVDGQEYEGQLMPADQARSIYEGYIRRNQDPALLEWMGTGMFKTSVFPIPPGATRTVNLRYSQVLQRDRQLTDYVFPLATAKYSSHAVEKLAFQVSIRSQGKIKSVYSPTHSVNVNRNGDHHATVSFEANNAIPVSDFRLFYDTSDHAVGASLLSYWPEGAEQGYFMMLASPEIERATVEETKKTIIVVLDRSGSMSGKKIEQAKEALRFVVNNLNPDDLFNLVAYDSEIEVFRPELERYTDETRTDALAFVEDIYAGGSTNIDGALETALGMIQDPNQPSYILFLTDGLPTAGETDELQIVENSKERNPHTTRLISLGVGYDVNSRLLDRLSRANRGESEYVRPRDDLEVAVGRIYQRISSPVMTNVVADFEMDLVEENELKPVNRIYPSEMPDLFQGQQLVLAGRYRHPGTVKVRLTGRVGENEQSLDFAGEFVGASPTSNRGFVEKIWATRRIGEIIDEIDLVGRNDELVTELIELSTKYGILTPYTSYLADDLGGGIPVADESRMRRVLNELDSLEESSGVVAFAQREAKQELQSSSAGAYSDSFAVLPANQSGGVGQSAPRGGFGFGGGGVLRDLAQDEDVTIETVRQVADSTLYYRGGLWIASNAQGVDPSSEDASIEEIERFSERYFELVGENSKSENTILAQQPDGIDLIIRLRGQVYRFK